MVNFYLHLFCVIKNCVELKIRKAFVVLQQEKSAAQLEVSFIFRWLKDHASQDLKQRVQKALLPEKGHIAKNSNISSDIFQLWLAASPANNNQHLQNVRPEQDYESLEVRKIYYFYSKLSPRSTVHNNNNGWILSWL